MLGNDYGKRTYQTGLSVSFEGLRQATLEIYNDEVKDLGEIKDV